MKHAKKLLALLLALVIALGLGATAMAEEPVLGEESEALIAIEELPEKDEAFGVQSLPFPLRTVTHIEAIWNGRIRYDYQYFTPQFDSSNVIVTIYFEQGEPVVLDRWWQDWNDSGTQRWQVFHNYDSAEGIVTIYYRDSNNWDDALETLPQSTFAYPGDNSILFRYEPFSAVTLNKAMTVDGIGRVFVLTPGRAGPYVFQADSQTAYISLFDADFEPIAITPNSRIRIDLEAGKPYYVLAETWNDTSCAFTVKYISPLRLFVERIQNWISSLFTDYVILGLILFPYVLFQNFLSILFFPINLLIIFFQKL